ncbi:hypothetical protein HDK64DRAFT_321498 [Phyllosticta capitalensis]
MLSLFARSTLEHSLSVERAQGVESNNSRLCWCASRPASTLQSSNRPVSFESPLHDRRAGNNNGGNLEQLFGAGGKGRFYKSMESKLHLRVDSIEQTKPVFARGFCRANPSTSPTLASLALRARCGAKSLASIALSYRRSIFSSSGTSFYILAIGQPPRRGSYADSVSDDFVAPNCIHRDAESSSATLTRKSASDEPEGEVETISRDDTANLSSLTSLTTPWPPSFLSIVARPSHFSGTLFYILANSHPRKLRQRGRAVELGYTFSTSMTCPPPRNVSRHQVIGQDIMSGYILPVVISAPGINTWEYLAFDSIEKQVNSIRFAMEKKFTQGLNALHLDPINAGALLSLHWRGATIGSASSEAEPFWSNLMWLKVKLFNPLLHLRHTNRVDFLKLLHGYFKLWHEDVTEIAKSGLRFKLINRLVVERKVPLMSPDFKNIMQETWIALVIGDGRLPQDSS